MSTPTIYEQIVNNQRVDFENYKRLHETLLLQLSDNQSNFNELQRSLPVLEAAGIRFDLSRDCDPIHKLDNGELVPRLTEISAHFFEHIVEIMISHGWVVLEVDHGDGALFTKNNARVYIAGGIPF